MKENEYQCAACKGVFEKGWSDEEAKEEAQQNFGKAVDDWKDDPVLICHDCYEKYHPARHPEEVERAKKII